MNTNGNGAMTIIEDEESSLGPINPSQATVSTQIQVMAAMADKRISTARMYPRSVARFKSEASQLLREDVETARSAEYAKPIGGGVVKGPSVRLAELAAMCWGNLEVEISEPTVTDKSIIVKASAWDLQKNYRQDGIATTSIIGRDGSRYKASMIETACMATAAKARRNAILNVIPRAYISDLLEVAKAVASGNKESLEVVRAKTLDYFARSFKVQREQIFELLGIAGVDDITEAHLDELRPIATSLKEGHAKPEEFFAIKTASKADEIKAKIEERKKATATSPPPAPTASPANGAASKEPPSNAALFDSLLQAYEDAGGDTGAFLMEAGYADVGQVHQSSGGKISKLCTKLKAETEARVEAAKAFAGTGTDVSAQAR